MPWRSNGSRWAEVSSTEMSLKFRVVVPAFLARNVRSMSGPWPLTPGRLPSRDSPTITSLLPDPTVARTKGEAPSCDRKGEVLE